LVTVPWPLAAQEPPEYRALAKEILAELVAIETTEEAGRTVEAAETVARRLLAAGFPEQDVQVVGPRPDLGNLVVRYRGDGTGGRPILLLAHMDVVPAVAEGWSSDPFELVERDGYLYGRGSGDNKAGVATIFTNFLRWKAEGWIPDRDLIAVVTADEETSGESLAWLVSERRDLVDAEFALNTDSGFGVLQDGIPVVFSVDTAEKMYLSFRLTATAPGGHSSEPGPENAINDLAYALVRIAEFAFPIRVNDLTREYFRQSAQDYPPEMAADMRALASDPGDLAAAERLAAASPALNAILRTTCVATELVGGEAENVLPRSAGATVNCRIYPGVDPGEVEATLRRVIDDSGISLERMNEPTPSSPSFLTPQLRIALDELVAEMFPTARIIPTMAPWASDAVSTRNAGIPTFGVSAFFYHEGEDSSHAADEGISVETFHDAVEFWCRMVKRLASDG
jgi:acetylornithine deacetylase/succinyl-diaminopimelate desuccinylase-like protein